VSVVLLVDDEPEMQALVAMCLEETGARVVQASSLGEAVAAAQRERPRVVLLDIGLGAEDGLALLPTLRSDPSLSGVPVVVFSVHDSRRQEALDEGADGFVSKPFHLSTLRRAVVEHLS
jgi:DNA-binding response OmpR family regulator